MLAMMVNMNRDPKKKDPISPAEFMPAKGKHRAEPITTDITALKMFLKG